MINISIDASQELLRKEKRLRHCDEDDSDSSVDNDNDRSSEVEEMESTRRETSLAEEEAASIKVDLGRSMEEKQDLIERQLKEMGEGSPPSEKQAESMERESTSDHNSNRYQGIIVLKVSGCLLNY